MSLLFVRNGGWRRLHLRCRGRRRIPRDPAGARQREAPAAFLAARLPLTVLPPAGRAVS